MAAPPPGACPAFRSGLAIRARGRLPGRARARASAQVAGVSPLLRLLGEAEAGDAIGAPNRPPLTHTGLVAQAHRVGATAPRRPA